MTEAERNKLAELEWHLLNETDPAIRKEVRKQFEAFHHCVYSARPGHRGVRESNVVTLRPGG